MLPQWKQRNNLSHNQVSSRLVLPGCEAQLANPTDQVGTDTQLSRTGRLCRSRAPASGWKSNEKHRHSWWVQPLHANRMAHHTSKTSQGHAGNSQKYLHPNLQIQVQWRTNRLCFILDVILMMGQPGCSSTWRTYLKGGLKSGHNQEQNNYV